MSFATTQLSVTSAAQNIIGPSSTVLNSVSASVWRPLKVGLVTLSAARVYLSPTSAGTTANSYVLLGLNVLNVDVRRTGSVWWAFTSAATTCRMTVSGGTQP